MSKMIHAIYIAQPYFIRQLRSPALWIFLAMGLCFPFLVGWDTESQSLEFGGLNLEMNFEAGRDWALEYAFYDLFIYGWLVSAFFVFNRVLMP